MAWPTMTVEVAFATDPLDTPTWTDVSAYVLALSTTGGRRLEVDATEPVEIEIVLDNSDRRFDPSHSGGPYSGNLTPNRRVRVQATHSAVTHDLFTGFVDRWPLPGRGNTVTIKATDALKLLATVPQPESVWAIEISASSPSAWWDCSGDATRLRDVSGNRLDGVAPDPVSGLQADPVIAGEAGHSLVFGLSGPAYLPPASAPAGSTFTIETWLHVDPAEDQSIYVLLCPAVSLYLVRASIIGTNPPGRLYFYTATGYVRSDRKLTAGSHHIAAVSDSGTLALYLDGVAVEELPTATAIPATAENLLRWGPHPDPTQDDPFGDGRYSRFDDLVIWDGVALSGSTIADHHAAGADNWAGDDPGDRAVQLLDAVGWPSALRNIDTASSTVRLAGVRFDPSATVTDALQRLEATEGGLLYVDHHDAGKVRFVERGTLLSSSRHTTSQATYTDADPAAGGWRYTDLELVYDDELVFNEVTVEWLDGEVTVEDTASVDAYTRRSLTVTTDHGHELHAEALAEWLLARYKEPRLRAVGLTLEPAAHHDLFAEVLARQVGDRVTVRFLPHATGAAITQELWVAGIEHSVDRRDSATWTTVLRLQSADDAPDVLWLWDDGTGTVGSTWDTETAWGL